jgi:N-acetylmuramoyl-L-alanine amidase
MRGVRETACLLLLMGVAYQVEGATRGARAERASSRSGVVSGSEAGPLTRAERLAAERRLAELGYWTGRRDGHFEEGARHALMAFQKGEGRKRTGRWSREEYRALMVAGPLEPLVGGPAHLEIDLVRQLLLVVDDAGRVVGVLPVSTGNGRPFISEGWARDAVTHPGWYTVFKKIPGRRESRLGLLYYPVYFMYGTAIHGAPSVPAYPASHGCVRIPMAFARRFYEIAPLGMPVVIHEGTVPPRPPPLPGGTVEGDGQPVSAH